MQRRLAYAMGDLVASLIAGVFAAMAAWEIIQPGWNMWLSMFAMMVVGMIVGMLIFFPASIVLGAMESMVPLMFNGMISGMVAGMAAAMMPIFFVDAVKMGAGSAVGGLLFIWVSNALLHGPTRDGQAG